MMRVLFCTSEVAPFSKSGGLADVAFSLPPALIKEKQQVEVITPLYQGVKQQFGDLLQFEFNKDITLGNNTYYCGLYSCVYNKVKTYFIDNEQFFKRERLYGYDDDKLRFAFFCKAVVEVMGLLDFKPQILHCNDWESALAIIYLKNDLHLHPELQNVKTVFTIHNIAYQGQFGRNELDDCFALDQSWFDKALGYYYENREDVNLMKGAMLLADAVSTVSKTYANELHFPRFGRGLQGVCDLVEHKMYGILNGIDMAKYDPSIVLDIPFKFSLNDLSGKSACKAHLQETFNLDKQNNWPLLVSVCRLVEQKGIELIKQIVPSLMEMGVQMIVFGQGEQHYVDYFKACTRQYPGQFGFSNDYSETLAAQIYAGGDLYLMPSEFEPCGLSQMMAMRYGTVPIVHETGGLKDSVRPYSDFDQIGDGFSFSNYQAKDLYLSIMEAIKLYFGDEVMFEVLRKRCMAKDFSWDKSARAYLKMYSDIVEDFSDMEISFEEAFANLKQAYEKLDARNRELKIIDLPLDYHLAVQVHLEGPGSGTFYIEVDHDKTSIEPYDYQNADAYLNVSYENLLNVVKGKKSADDLFMNGQLKVSGNISKGAAFKRLFIVNE